MKPQMLPIDVIRKDGGTQPRSLLDFDVIDVYMDAMKGGAEFPPVDVFYDGTDYWLADGFHRVKARFAADFEDIACLVHQGTVQDAQWFSYAANKTNGLYRSNADKQRAIKAALAHPKGASLSDRKIAEHVGVDHKSIAAWRARSVPTTGSACSSPLTRICPPNPPAAPSVMPAPAPGPTHSRN